MTKSGRQKYGTATANDEKIQVLMQFSESGFPDWRFSGWHQAVFQLQGTNCLLRQSFVQWQKADDPKDFAPNS
jgi:hypothetical protein